MKSVSRKDITIIKMEISPLDDLVNSVMRVIYNSYIYESNLKWNKKNLAEKKDYLNIPELL